MAKKREKDEAAAALARKRWSKTTKAERVEVSQAMHKARYGGVKKKSK